MASDSNSRSLLEPPARQFIGDLAEERLMVRLAASQGVEAEAARVEVDLGTDQPVGPRGVDLEAAAQHLHGPLRVGAPQEDQPAARVGLQVQRPALGERPTARGRLDPRRGPQPARRPRTCPTGPAGPPATRARTGPRPWPASGRCSSRSRPGSPVSRGGANTGTTPRPRHSRMTRPTTSGCWCGPWKIVSLSNWA